jgi:hypothetical protein
MAYILVFTRPDISLTHFVLSCHLTSLGKQHLPAATHAWRFLIRTRNLALKTSALSRHKAVQMVNVPQGALPEAGRSFEKAERNLRRYVEL